MGNDNTEHELTAEEAIGMLSGRRPAWWATDPRMVRITHVVVRAGLPGEYRYALADDTPRLPVVGPWRRTKKRALEDGIAAVIAKAQNTPRS